MGALRGNVCQRAGSAKTAGQLDLQVLHRARQRLVSARTRLTNQLRAVLLERGEGHLPSLTGLLRHGAMVTGRLPW